MKQYSCDVKTESVKAMEGTKAVIINLVMNNERQHGSEMFDDLG